MLFVVFSNQHYPTSLASGPHNHRLLYDCDTEPPMFSRCSADIGRPAARYPRVHHDPRPHTLALQALRVPLQQQPVRPCHRLL